MHKIFSQLFALLLTLKPPSWYLSKIWTKNTSSYINISLIHKCTICRWFRCQPNFLKRKKYNSDNLIVFSDWTYDVYRNISGRCLLFSVVLLILNFTICLWSISLSSAENIIYIYIYIYIYIRSMSTSSES